MSTVLHRGFYRCSFCGKETRAVDYMIEGPTKGINICNNCVKVCNSLIEEAIANENRNKEK